MKLGKCVSNMPMMDGDVDVKMQTQPVLVEVTGRGSDRPEVSGLFIQKCPRL